MESSIKYFCLFINFNSRYATVQPFILLINMASRNWIHKYLLHVSSLQSTFQMNKPKSIFKCIKKNLFILDCLLYEEAILLNYFYSKTERSLTLNLSV